MVGGFLDPSVPRSAGVAPQEGRAAHGPRHPALPIPLRLVRGFDRLLYCALLVFCVSFVLVISSWGLICCMVISPFRTRPLSVRLFAPLFFLSVWLVRRRRFFFFVFFCFFRCWGNTNPLVVCVSPCVSSSWPRTTSSTRSSWSTRSSRQRTRTCFLCVCVIGGWQRLCPHCVCFFRRSRWFCVLSVVVGLFPLFLCLFLPGLQMVCVCLVFSGASLHMFLLDLSWFCF